MSYFAPLSEVEDPLVCLKALKGSHCGSKTGGTG